MRRIAVAMLAMLSVWLAIPAQAQWAAGGSGAMDWFKLGKGQDAQEILSPVGYLAHDVVTNDAGTEGLTFAYRSMSSMDAGTTGEMVHEFSIEKWQFAFDQALEWFAGIKGEVWSKDLVGDTKFLGGARGGVRFDVGVPWEMSMHGALGPDSVAHWGAFFGVRISQGTEGEG